MALAVTDAASVTAAARAAPDVSILINNAGIPRMNSVLDPDTSNFRGQAGNPQLVGRVTGVVGAVFAAPTTPPSSEGAGHGADRVHEIARQVGGFTGGDIRQLRQQLAEQRPKLCPRPRPRPPDRDSVRLRRCAAGARCGGRSWSIRRVPGSSKRHCSQPATTPATESRTASTATTFFRSNTIHSSTSPGTTCASVGQWSSTRRSACTSMTPSSSPCPRAGSTGRPSTSRWCASTSPPPPCNTVCERGLERDRWKLAHWDEYWSEHGTRPCRWTGVRLTEFANDANDAEWTL